MFPVTFRPERTLERKCSAPGIPPHESVVAVYVMFDLPTADKRVGANGISNPPPKYASVMLMMKNWSPALGGGLNLFHFSTDRVAFGTLLLTLSFQPSLSGGRTSVLIRYGLARVPLGAAAGAEAAATSAAMSRKTDVVRLISAVVSASFYPRGMKLECGRAGKSSAALLRRLRQGAEGGPG